jgi:hypothetical protein
MHEVRYLELHARLGVFQRNKIPVELKVFGIVNYIFMSSFRRTAKVLSLFKKRAMSAVHYWVQCFKEKAWGRGWRPSNGENDNPG